MGAVNVPVFLKGAGGMTPNPNFVPEMTKQFPPDAKLVVSCQAGRRSETACQMLDEAGFSGHKNVLGGYSSWVAAGLPTQ